MSLDPWRDIANRMRLNRYESAIRRWVDALNERGPRALVEAAVHPEIRVERYGFGDHLGVLMQTIQGTTGVTEWFGISPVQVQFEVAGPVELEQAESPESTPKGSPTSGTENDAEGVAKVRYQVSAVGFTNGGTWRYRISEDGRIVWLAHHPDDLADAVQERDVRTGENRHHHDDPHHLEHHH